MATGESPYECAQREASEEVGVALQASDLELRCIIAERDYQETGHWLMFVFSVLQLLDVAPASIDEGEFRFFAIEELDTLPMPPMDRRILLERLIGDTSGSLHLLRACSGADEAPSLVVEEERIGGGA